MFTRKIDKDSTATVEEVSSNVVMTHVFHTHTHRLTFYIFHEPRYLVIKDTNKASKAQRYTAQSEIAFSCM